MQPHESPHDLRHPALAIYARWCAGGRLPDRCALEQAAAESPLALPDGRRLQFVAATGRTSALTYENRIAGCGEIALREDSVHDQFNALAWLALPQTKAALNAVHVRQAEAPTANRRDRRRDAATLLDESGLLLACDAPELVALLRARQWRALFAERRAEVAAHMRPIAIGHGICARLACGRPHRGITARALVLDLPVDLRNVCLAPFDAMAAAFVRRGDFAPEWLLPLPIAALPGWDCEGLDAKLFDDLSVFRPLVLR
jgi:Protein of unknown function (DUF3025)